MSPVGTDSVVRPQAVEKSIVMVCGAARSGTTMLDLMLGNSADAFSCGEVYALFRPYRAHHFNPVCSCGDADCSVWRSLKGVSAEQFHMTALERAGINHVIDSSKDLRWVLDSNEWAARNRTVIMNVLIWKDPVDLAYSHWKRGKSITYFRKQFLDYYERFLALGLPFSAVSYNDLVATPAVELKQLCSQLGLAYEPGKEEFWHKQHHHCFGSAGTAGQVSAGNSRVGLERDFPAAFVQEYERRVVAQGHEARLERIIHALNKARAGAFSQTGLRPSLLHSGVRPVWYYRHAIKGWLRRHFPDRRPVVN